MNVAKDRVTHNVSDPIHTRPTNGKKWHVFCECGWQSKIYRFRSSAIIAGSTHLVNGVES